MSVPCVNVIVVTVQRPLAAVVIGGLVTSTLLTLVVLPSVYGWFEEKQTQYKEVR